MAPSFTRRVIVLGYSVGDELIVEAALSLLGSGRCRYWRSRNRTLQRGERTENRLQGANIVISDFVER